MRRSVCLLCLAAILTVFGMSNRASADVYRDRDDPRIYGGIGLGFGGHLEIEGNPDYDLDLGTSIGGQFGVDFILARYFALGAEVRLTGFELEDSSSRSRFIDIVAKPRLRLPLRNAEIYATVPIGLTIPRLADFHDGGDAEEELGWNIGVGGGATFFITESFGLNVEPIWLIHKFGVENGDATAKQFALLLNAVIAL